MTTVLLVAVAVLAAFGAANLGLVLRLSAIVRDLPVQSAADRDELSVGDRLPEFTPIETLSGEVVTHHDASAAPTLIGFFTPSCKPCHEAIPDFAAAAADLLHAGGRVLAMVRVHPNDDLTDTMAGLAGCPVRLITDADTSLTRIFKVGGYPTVLRFVAGTVTATSIDALLENLPHLAHA
jgi:thiol-disulfide isomerase/thioredoxin